MRLSLVCASIALAALGFAAEADADGVQDHFKSKNYTVTWGAPRTFDRSAELEIGHGSGHGFNLAWLRFQPREDGVDVLSISFDPGRQPYRSKWPTDHAEVTVKLARMTAEAYGRLLRDLAVIDAAEIKPVPDERGLTRSRLWSSHDFWVYARLTAKEKTLVDLEWAGYQSTGAELEIAKPQAAVAIARAAVEELEFKQHLLTDAERAWASAKFGRDWTKFEDESDHWWVRERYIIMIGVAGDASALPVLQEILQGDPKDHCVYDSVNAITRLTHEDVRDQPVEEMDIEKTRPKVLDLLRCRNPGP